MKRILFVDDEQAVLDGLQNVLRKQRKEWQMVFALGGSRALAEMEASPFDVIVSDMRMPGMDGAALLTRVKDLYPATARIVLSGHSEQEALLRALPVVHRYLHKPCDGATLVTAVQRTCQLQGLLHNDCIRDIIGRLERLPSPPGTFLELTRLLSDRQAGGRDVAAVIERDPAMSAKVLQLVNSAYFGLSRSPTSVQQAVSYLGMDVLRGVTLSAHVFGTAEGTSIPVSVLAEIQSESFATGMIARQICRSSNQADHAFTAGVVHDIGRIVIGMSLPERFREIERISSESALPIQTVEQELLGVTHAEVGAYLLGVWGVPFNVVETVALHHTPSMRVRDDVDVLAAVHVADYLAESERAPRRERPVTAVLDEAFLESVGLLAELPGWQLVARDHYARVEATASHPSGTTE